MKNETRTFCIDAETRVEACRLENIRQPFPNHFHDHYVVGFIAAGGRTMSCANREYELHTGDAVLLRPGQNHACLALADQAMNFCSLNISEEVIRDLICAVGGENASLNFNSPAVSDDTLCAQIERLNRLILTEAIQAEKQEALLQLASRLLERHCTPAAPAHSTESAEIARACAFIDLNYASHITLDDICQSALMSKSTLLREFTRAKGITPYRYLETVRINNAKRLLEKGVSPAEAALSAGFSDQSHFSRYFRQFIGTSPGAYKELFKERNEKHESTRK